MAAWEEVSDSEAAEAAMRLEVEAASAAAAAASAAAVDSAAAVATAAESVWEVVAVTVLAGAVSPQVEEEEAPV